MTESHVQTRPTGSNTSKPVQTCPNEICSMHNSHAILNDCKMMYLKYINSSARNIFVFCYNLKILVKSLVGCYCHVLSEPLTNFCLHWHDYLFCNRAPNNFPYTSIFHSQAMLLTLRKESRINHNAEMQRS